jgi:hypothetical protein
MADAVGANLELVRPAGAYYFHGTRVIDPDDFARRGILPLDQVLESIWSTLSGLVLDFCSPDEWDEFRRSVEHEGAGGHSGDLYRHKTAEAPEPGPFAELVRATLVRPTESSTHDYLGCPEIVEDIAACFEAAYGVDLSARFLAVATPTIVKFFAADACVGAVRSALWYAYYTVRGEELSRQSCWAFDGEGRAIPPSDVAGVEAVGD